MSKRVYASPVRDEILRLVKERGPITGADLRKALNRESISLALAQLRAMGLMHIEDYLPITNRGGRPKPLYISGPGEEPPEPRALYEDRQQAYRDRHRVRLMIRGREKNNRCKLKASWLPGLLPLEKVKSNDC